MRHKTLALMARQYRAKEDRAAFVTWFAQLDIVHFSPAELLNEKTTKGYTNKLPPRSLWDNCVAPISVLDELREHFGKPITITSGYRDANYNRLVDGVPGSQHTYFRAFDIRCKGVSAKRVYDVLLAWRREGRFAGGLGLYERSRFVHIDTRGSNATWRQR